MSDIALKVEGIGKRYRIGLANGGRGPFRYKSLRDSLGGIVRRPVQALRSTVLPEPMAESNSFWALKDINFEVMRGEVVGVIGRNGAGKSTLLKILSRITKPTVGRVSLYGRVGSLLEVGTGFHPELTGRENIYLNGAILGMTGAEVKAKFDEIVAFSEIEKFLDTAVKHYSSGMYMRLAFAVAAHLDPEILVVDEVLAVGDLTFQRKCLGRMKDVAVGGKTVLLVSHNMAAIRALCVRSVLLRAGEFAAIGSTNEVIAKYSELVGMTQATDAAIGRQGSGVVKIEEIQVFAVNGGPPAVGGDLAIRLKYVCPGRHRLRDIRVIVGIFDGDGRNITFLQNDILGADLEVNGEAGAFECVLPKLRLTPGQYTLNYQVYHGHDVLDFIEQAARFTVEEGDFFGTGKLTYSRLGGVYFEQAWRMVQ